MGRQLFLCALLLSACKGKDQVASEKVADAYCEKARTSCCTAQELTDFIGDAKSCESRVQGGFGIFLTKNAEAEGRATFSETAVDACAAAIAAASCETLKMRDPAALAPCTNIVVPKVATGGFCLGSSDCISGACLITENATSGTCLETAALNQSCENATCADGSFCSNKVCVALKADGASCGAHSECASGGCLAPTPGGARVCTQRGGANTKCYLQQGCSVGGNPVATGLPIALILFGFGVRRRRGKT